MTTPPLDVGPPRDSAEQEALAALLSRALFFPPLSQYNWIEVEGPENLRVVRQNGQVQGGLSVQHMEQWFGGRPLPVGAVRCVGVSPELRGRGLATALLRGVLEELRHDGVPLAALYPATQPVYRRVGFNQAGLRMLYSLPLQDVDVRHRGLTFSSVDLEDLAQITSLYETHCQRTAGHLRRNLWAWNRKLRSPSPRSPIQGLIVRNQGAPEGYLLYYVEPPQSLEDFVGHIHIRDWVALTSTASDALWTFLSDQRSVNGTVRWVGPPNDPRLMRIANPKHKVVQTLTWMLRLIDVPTALEQRGYPPHLQAELHLDVRDDVLPWNHGRFVCTVAHGTAEVRPGGDGHLALPVRALAAIFSGFLSPWEAFQSHPIYGDEDTLSLAETLFSGPTPWMPDMF